MYKYKPYIQRGITISTKNHSHLGLNNTNMHLQPEEEGKSYNIEVSLCSKKLHVQLIDSTRADSHIPFTIFGVSVLEHLLPRV